MPGEEPRERSAEPSRRAHRERKRRGRWMRGSVGAVAVIGVVTVATTALVMGPMVGRHGVGRQGGGVQGDASAGGSSAVLPEPANSAQRPPHVDYLLDLNTGATWPVPAPILRALGNSHVRSFGAGTRYAVSPDHALLAFVGSGERARPQIFTADLRTGSALRQVTHDLSGARSPAWSPDGRQIAYVGYGDGTEVLYVLDLDTAYTDRIRDANGCCPQFTPDGASLLYTHGGQKPQLRTVSLPAGPSTLLFPLRGGLHDAGNGSLSPDGTLVTFLGGGTFGFGHCGPCRWVANADGTHRRVISNCFETNPAGAWSPDGRRIACRNATNGISVVDIAAHSQTTVARAQTAIWVNQHTLLLEV